MTDSERGMLIFAAVGLGRCVGLSDRLRKTHQSIREDYINKTIKYCYGA